MPRARSENTQQVSFKIPEAWLAMADDAAAAMSPPGVAMTRTDAMRAALFLGLTQMRSRQASRGGPRARGQAVTPRPITSAIVAASEAHEKAGHVQPHRAALALADWVALWREHGKEKRSNAGSLFIAKPGGEIDVRCSYSLFDPVEGSMLFSSRTSFISIAFRCVVHEDCREHLDLGFACARGTSTIAPSLA